MPAPALLPVDEPGPDAFAYARVGDTLDVLSNLRPMLGEPVNVTAYRYADPAQLTRDSRGRHRPLDAIAARRDAAERASRRLGVLMATVGALGAAMIAFGLLRAWAGGRL